MERVAGLAAVGSLSGPITFWNSTIEPGQPCVITNGSASAWGERTCTKWIPRPSRVVRNCGNAFRRASRARQSYFSAQYSQISRT